MAGGSQIIISKDGIRILTAARFEVKAGQHQFKAGEKVLQPQTVLPTAYSSFSNQFDYQIQSSVIENQAIEKQALANSVNENSAIENLDESYIKQEMKAFVLDRATGTLLAQSNASDDSISTMRFYTDQAKAVVGMLCLSRRVSAFQQHPHTAFNDPLLEEVFNHGAANDLSSLHHSDEEEH